MSANSNESHESEDAEEECLSHQIYMIILKKEDHKQCFVRVQSKFADRARDSSGPMAYSPVRTAPSTCAILNKPLGDAVDISEVELLLAKFEMYVSAWETSASSRSCASTTSASASASAPFMSIHSSTTAQSTTSMEELSYIYGRSVIAQTRYNAAVQKTLPLLSQTKAVIHFDSKTMKITAVNHSACKLLGYPSEELIGMNFGDVLNRSHRKTASVLIGEHLETSEDTSIMLDGKTIQMVKRDGKVFPVSAWIRRLPTDARGVAVFDSLERKQIRLVVNSRGVVVSADPVAATLFECSEKEIVGAHLRSLIPEAELPLPDGYISKDIRNQKLLGRTKCNTLFPLNLRVKKIACDQDADGDVSSHSSETRSAFVVIISVLININGIIVISVHGDIEKCSRDFSHSLFGQRKVIGKHITSVIPGFRWYQRRVKSRPRDSRPPLPPLSPLIGEKDQESQEVLDSDSTTPQAVRHNPTCRSVVDSESRSTNILSWDKSVRSLGSSLTELTDVANRLNLTMDDDTTTASLQADGQVSSANYVSCGTSGIANGPSHMSDHKQNRSDPEDDHTDHISDHGEIYSDYDDRADHASDREENCMDPEDENTDHVSDREGNSSDTEDNTDHISDREESCLYPDDHTDHFNDYFYDDDEDDEDSSDSSDYSDFSERAYYNSSHQHEEYCNSSQEEEYDDREDDYFHDLTQEYIQRDLHKLEKEIESKRRRKSKKRSHNGPQQHQQEQQLCCNGSQQQKQQQQSYFNGPQQQQQRMCHNGPQPLQQQIYYYGSQVNYNDSLNGNSTYNMTNQSTYTTGEMYSSSTSHTLEPQADDCASATTISATELHGYSRLLSTADVSISSDRREGFFSGRAKYSEGFNVGYIDIAYVVKEIKLPCSRTVFCVWVSSACPNLLDLAEKDNFDNQTSSTDSTSMDQTYGHPASRSGSVSQHSQCEEDLVAGKYSENYTNLQQIGKGAFGYVKMAYRNSDGLLVITKFIHKLKVHQHGWVQDTKLGKCVPLEISLLYAVNHPNIVQLLDVFENSSFFQVVMQKHGAGMDLFDFVDRTPKLEEPLISYIFRQIVAAVDYLHSLHILHRDIKDENVIIDQSFRVKLIDFGSATYMISSGLFSTFYGTMEYCSPEVLAGNRYQGPPVEVWSLGVTLYVLTFGENPFFDAEETMRGELHPPEVASPDLLDLLHAMLELDPNRRCTVPQLVAHPWVNQPVDPTAYNFQELVNYSDPEWQPDTHYAGYRQGAPSRPVCHASNDQADQSDGIHEIIEDDNDHTDIPSSNSLTSITPIEDVLVNPPTLDVTEKPVDSQESPTCEGGPVASTPYKSRPTRRGRHREAHSPSSLSSSATAGAHQDVATSTSVLSSVQSNSSSKCSTPARCTSATSDSSISIISAPSTQSSSSPSGADQRLICSNRDELGSRMQALLEGLPGFRLAGRFQHPASPTIPDEELPAAEIPTDANRDQPKITHSSTPVCASSGINIAPENDMK